MKRLFLLLGVLLCFTASEAMATAKASEQVHTGRLEVDHADFFAAGYSVDRLHLHLGPTTLSVADPERRIARLAGQEVTLAGRRDGGTLRDVRVVAARPAPAAGDPLPGFPTPGPPLGERRVALLLISPPTDAERRWDPAITEELVFGAGDSVASFFRDASGGRTTLAGEVRGWYSGAYTTCDTTLIKEQAMAAARAEGVRFEEYHHVVTMFPKLPDCGFNGSAYIGGTESWINGDQRDVRVIAHELGHNVGMHHAAAEHCTRDGVPVALSDTCETEEYGDPVDVMGKEIRLFNGARRVGLGWIDANRSRVADAPGLYELHSINSPGDGTKELIVPRPGTCKYHTGRTEFVHLELRSPLGGFDAFALGDPVLGGIGARLTCGPEAGGFSRLLDLTPGSAGGHRDGQLRVGERFTEPQGGTTIVLESLRDGVAAVRVAAREAPATEPAAPAGPGTEEAPAAPSSEPVTAAPPAPPSTSPPPIFATPDTTRPGVRARVRSRRRLAIRTTGGAVRVEVRLDGRLLARRPGARVTVRLPRRALRGRHRLAVAATDAAGNRQVRRYALVRGALRRAR